MGFLTGMNDLVGFQRVLVKVTLVALVTVVFDGARVHVHVPIQMDLIVELLVAQVALEMSLHVFPHMRFDVSMRFATHLAHYQHHVSLANLTLLLLFLLALLFRQFRSLLLWHRKMRIGRVHGGRF